MSKRKSGALLESVFVDLDSAAAPRQHFVNAQTLSQDHRRIRQQLVRVAPPSPVKHTAKKPRVLDSVLEFQQSNAPLDWSSSSLAPGGSSFDSGGLVGLGTFGVWDKDDGAEDLDESKVERAKQMTRESVSSAQPMSDWKPLASKFLSVLMTREGRGDRRFLKCCKCQKTEENLCRCSSCFGQDLWCSSCLVEGHARQPFHRVERWNGMYFEKTTLAKLGLVIQLCHPPGSKCDAALRLRSGFVVVDLDGVQDVELNKCECRDVPVWEQLLHSGLYPATVIEPQTAFSFDVLSHFHNLTCKGKVNSYDFYHALEARTDGSGLTDVKDRYEAFVRVMRQWRYLKMLKRSGVGNDPSRCLSDVKPGELAVRCLACPRPGINLPADWEKSTPLAKMFLYHKFISIDACFRLKRRKVSSERKDPGLFTGMAYFVPQEPYQKWVKSVPMQNEISSCNGLAAIAQANTKYRKGYATTGAILCLCSRHEMVEPTSMVDTNEGEKYMLSDWSVGCSQQHSDECLIRFLVYDIACQYYKKFFQRMALLPAAARIGIHQERWKFAVPKLHIQGHERKCQENFALQWIMGAGMTDGEGIERHWANLGPIATSTREMGPGHRRDTIDDHLGSWNWMKTARLGILLRKKRRDARQQQQLQHEELEDFSAGVSEHVSEWLKRVEDWESGRTKDNPYTLPRLEPGSTEQDVRFEYALKEAESEKLGIPALHEISPSAFLTLGLEIEDQQRRLAIKLAGNDFVTPMQKTELVEQRSRISRGIARFRTMQKVYMPIALTCTPANVSTSSEVDVDVEDVDDSLTTGGSCKSKPVAGVEAEPLWLPSSWPQSYQKVAGMEAWVEMEAKFRQAQLKSSLDGIRTHLFVRARLNVERSLHVRHQRDSTRARQALARNDMKINVLKSKFRAARSAVVNLVGENKVAYPCLLDEHIRCLDELDTHALRNRRKVLGNKRTGGEQPLITPGESRKRTSWIWKGVDVTGDSKAVLEAVRIEWTKTWARKRRWDEELELVSEEMRHVVEGLQYEARVWETRAAEMVGSPEAEGRAAYASRQAAIRVGLAAKFIVLWNKPDPKPKMRVTAKQVVAEEEEEEDNQSSDNDDLYEEHEDL